MSMQIYLEAEPLSALQRYHEDQAAASVAYVGTLRKHPYDEEKCLLISDPGEPEPAIYEFRIRDIAGAEELASPVDEKGTSWNLARLWVRKGSFGVRYEPFEVDDPPRKGHEAVRAHDQAG